LGSPPTRGPPSPLRYTDIYRPHGIYDVWRALLADRPVTDSKLKKWPPAVQDEITSVMMEKADGMYAHVFRT
jgi:hypothetical protein